MISDKKLKSLCQIAHSSTLQEIVDIAYKLFGNPVFITDMSHTTLAYTKSIEVSDPIWQTRVVQSKVEYSTITQDKRTNWVNATSIENRMPVLVEDDNVPVPRIIKVLVSNGYPVGVVILTAYLHPLKDGDIELMELMSSYVLPLMWQEQYHVSANHKNVENYFIKLLNGEQYESEQVMKCLNNLGYASQPNLYVLAISAKSECSGNDFCDITLVMNELSRLPFCRAFLYDANIVCVYGCEKEILYWDVGAPKVADILRHHDLVAGVSRRFSEASRLREYYLQSVCAAELGHLLTREGSFLQYDNLSMYQMLRNIPESLLKQYCHQKILDLEEYDRKHNADFCTTLQVYLENTKSLAKTAELLFVHRNTVHYRVNKCMDLLGSNLEDGNEIFIFILSLHIVEYRKKMLKQ